MEGVANTIDTFIHSLTGSEDVEALHFCTSLLENFPDLNKGKLYDKTKQKNLLRETRSKEPPETYTNRI